MIFSNSACIITQLPSPDIFLSHDWPNRIERHGDVQTLVARNTHLKFDIDAGTLGSPPLWGLLSHLRPQWWLSGHMRTRFEATVKHDGPIKDERSPATKFLALDKCLPNRQFLEVLEIATPSQAKSSTRTTPTISFDPHWLAITRALHPYLSRKKEQGHFPDEEQVRALVARAGVGAYTRPTQARP
ncbi:hypothetical protein H0H81_011637 [Sphagnurus paluster]|uniref:Lariat debranching enzyme C-terminal domain-containing protein n=1 Tax=Sphagnurus paluster TaxID=117069 RepID=A0A9P7FU33_9AGAR|nr:hypothetical protein H0H81_011637 [Sphagnurus paluster]